MGCGTNTIPGFAEYDKQYKKDVRNPSLEAKMSYELSKSGDTQVPNTIATYRKVKKKHFAGVKGSDMLDYGAGLGIAAEEFGMDSFEPYAKEGFTPNYTEASQIDKKYKGIISNAVINVLPMEQRVEAVQNIGGSLAVGGKAVVMSRKTTDLDSLKNPQPYEDGVITQGKGTFQKGFGYDEVLNFVKSILGADYSVVKTGVGSNGLLITRLK